MDKSKIVTASITAIVLVFMFAFSLWAASSINSLKGQLSDMASSTSKRLAPLELTQNEITNLRSGGVIASSTPFIISIYNANIAIQDLLNQMHQVQQR